MLLPLTVSVALCVLQLLGVCGSVIAAGFQIESIVGTGPIFSVLGLALAYCGKRCRSTGMAVVGASASVLSLSTFLLIVSLDWAPDEARLPVGLMLLAYELLIVPIGLLALYRLQVGGPADDSRAAWQFNLQSLLLLTLLAAIALAAMKLASDQRLPIVAAAGIGLGTATLLAMALIALRALQHLGRHL